MSSISVCIIAKNEEKNIYECIKSVYDIADEIILLDTGSTDKTIEIAQQFDKVKIYHTVWEDDFSKAMNLCISYAQYDWVLMIDADERINEFTQNNLRVYLDNHVHKDKSLIIKFKNINMFSSRESQNYFKCGVFRNHKGLCFVVPVHQYLINEKNDILIEHSKQFQFLHYQANSDDIIKRKNLKYIKILKDFLKNPDNKKHDFYCYKHIADSYHDLKKYDKAVEYYTKSYNIQKDIIKNSFYKANLVSLVKEMLFYTFRYNEALPFVVELLNSDNQKKEAVFYYAYVNHRLEIFDIALEYYHKALKMDSEYLKNQILGELGRLYISMKQYDKGLKFLLESYSENKNDYISFHLIKFFILHDDYQTALKYDKHKKFSYQKYLNIPDNQKQLDILETLITFKGWDLWEINEIKNKINQLKLIVP
jgi:glycosyltransferase involved in cell wall biosynthesis